MGYGGAAAAAPALFPNKPSTAYSRKIDQRFKFH